LHKLVIVVKRSSPILLLCAWAASQKRSYLCRYGWECSCYVWAGRFESYPTRYFTGHLRPERCVLAAIQTNRLFDLADWDRRASMSLASILQRFKVATHPMYARAQKEEGWNDTHGPTNLGRNTPD